MLEFLKQVNQNYAGILSCFVALISVVVTVVYVVFTHAQMKAAKTSVTLMKKELKQSQQPCVIPNIKEIRSGPAMSNGRRQMHVRFSLENISNTPALSVYSLSYLVLQHTIDENGQKEVDMFSGPFYFPNIKGLESADAHLHYENQQINAMFADLSEKLRKNWERIKNNPSQHRYRGPNIVIHVFYRNISRQWFESKLVQEISWAFDETTKKKTKHNLNEYTLPPRELTDEIDFQLQLVSPHISPLNVSLVDEKIVSSMLSRYKERWPDLFVEYEDATISSGRF